MIYRPVNDAGDVLPVMSSTNLLRGASAVAQHTQNRLCLLSGDWWENPAWGNAIIEMLEESRFTEADQRAIASYLSSYIRETAGVLDVRDVQYSVEGRQFHFSCVIETENGMAGIHYNL